MISQAKNLILRACSELPFDEWALIEGSKLIEERVKFHALLMGLQPVIKLKITKKIKKQKRK